MKKPKVKTHTLNGLKIQVKETKQIDGICDINVPEIIILKGNSIRALGSVLEESLHMMGIPEKYLHKPKREQKPDTSMSKVDDLARLLWRLGWRRIR